MSADRALVAAVVSAVKADAGVRAILGDPVRIYDLPPPEPVFPYATLSRVESRSTDTSDGEALEHAMTLHVWSRYGGRAEAIDAIAAVRNALHDAPLSVAGRRLVFLFVQFTDVFRSGDTITTHGVLRLRAVTEAG
ncbi:genetransfer agent (GTA) ORFG08 [alpha proteobacterium U9-1i]|nr:genetransfer agent (GTA) ORFG08 [alpha proteobacterium U9-1i]